MIGMMPPNKKIATLILQKKKPNGEETSEVGPEIQEDDDIAMDTVADKIMGALEAKDKKAFIAGLKDFLDIIGADEAEDESDDVVV